MARPRPLDRRGSRSGLAVAASQRLPAKPAPSRQEPARAPSGAVAAARRPPIPGSVLARGGARRGRSARPEREGRRASIWGCSAPGWTGCSPGTNVGRQRSQRPAPCSGGSRCRRRPGNREDDDRVPDRGAADRAAAQCRSAAPLVALAAPTARLQPVWRRPSTIGGDARRVRRRPRRLQELHATTLHRLLGWRPDSNSRFPPQRGQRCRTTCDRRRDVDGVAVAMAVWRRRSGRTRA